MEMTKERRRQMNKVRKLTLFDLIIMLAWLCGLILAEYHVLNFDECQPETQAVLFYQRTKSEFFSASEENRREELYNIAAEYKPGYRDPVLNDMIQCFREATLREMKERLSCNKGE